MTVNNLQEALLIHSATPKMLHTSHSYYAFFQKTIFDKVCIHYFMEEMKPANK
jgi:hypothetical protein